MAYIITGIIYTIAYVHLVEDPDAFHSGRFDLRVLYEEALMNHHFLHSVKQLAGRR